MPETITLNKTQDKEYRLPCAQCLGETRHKVLQSVDISGEQLDGEYQYGDNFQIVQCLGCDSVSFRKCHSDSEDYYYDQDDEDLVYIETIDLYPSRVAGRHKLRQVHFLPPTLSR